MDKSTLLDQLRIDRTPEASPPKRFRIGSLIGAGLAMIGIGLVWFLLVRPDRPTVHLVPASSIESGTMEANSLLDASGYVVARRSATVSSKVTGKVAEVMIEEGQKVQAGQIMARLDDTNAQAVLDQALAQVNVAEAGLRSARSLVQQRARTNERYQKLHESGFLSDQGAENILNDYNNANNDLGTALRQVAAARAAAEVAARNKDDTVIRAPFTGIVTVKAAQPGEMVSPVTAGGGFTRTGIGTVVDMDSLEVEVDVAESFINRVVYGMPAIVKLNAYPDRPLAASVAAVIPTADRSKATVSVRVALNVRDPRVLPDMGARVSFLNPEATKNGGPARSVSVPNDAVLIEGAGRGSVFTVDHGRLERRTVQLGARTSSGQTLRSGLAYGDEVVVGNLKGLKNGQRVNISKKAMVNE